MDGGTFLRIKRRCVLGAGSGVLCRGGHVVLKGFSLLTGSRLCGVLPVYGGSRRGRVP